VLRVQDLFNVDEDLAICHELEGGDVSLQTAISATSVTIQILTLTI
jgi:hypothetical protein